MQAARSQGKRASLNVDKLIINGSVYTVDSLSTLPSELSPARRATRTDGEAGVTIFFTDVSPMLNFNKCTVVLPDGTVLHVHSGEQGYCKDKAAHFKDKDAERRIRKWLHPLNVTTLVNISRTSKKINGLLLKTKLCSPRMRTLKMFYYLLGIIS